MEAYGQKIHLPGNRGSINNDETELVIWIGRKHEKGMIADEVIDRMGIGIDFTLRDVQNELKKKGYPWLLAKGFPNSAVVSKFLVFPRINELKEKDNHLFYVFYKKDGLFVTEINSLLFFNRCTDGI